VPGRVVDTRAVADPGVPHLADVQALGLELGLRGRYVRHAERDRRRRERGELVLVRRGRHHRERDIGRLVLDPVLVVEVLVARQPEDLAVEALRGLDVVHRDADVVDARDLHQGCLPSGYGAYRWWRARRLQSGSLYA